MFIYAGIMIVIVAPVRNHAALNLSWNIYIRFDSLEAF